MRIENIAINDIAIDTPGWDQFIFTYPLEPGKLTAAIQTVGLQQPVTLAVVENRFYIVLGVKRVLACRELRRSEIPAIIRRTDSAEAVLWLSLHEKISAAPLNVMEKSRALMRFKELWENDFTALREKICPLLELPPTIDSIEIYLFLARLPEWLQMKLATGELAPAHVALLSSFRHDEIESMAQELFVRCQPSVQEAREMIENFSSVCAREECRPGELLAFDKLNALLNDSAISARERTAKVREWLHTQRFPLLSKTEKTFRSLVAPVEKKSGISIHPPRGFEGDTCQVSMKLSNEAEVEKAATALKLSLADNTWKKVFKLLRDGGTESVE